MKGLLTALLLVIGLFVAPAMAQQPPGVRKVDAAQIDHLIEALDSPRFSERERATRELLALEGDALVPLRKSLTTGRSIEFTRRARAILDALAIYEPGGEIVNGLKVRLGADRDTVKPGDTVKLTTRLCNMTAKPLNVMVGYTTCGNYFECGSALFRINPVPGKPAAEIAPKCQVGFCGTGAGPIYVTLAPKSVLNYETTATLAQHPGGSTVYTLGAGKYFTIEGTGVTDAVRMVLSITPSANQPRPARPNLKGSGIRPTDEDAPFWHGTIKSNDVQLKLAQ